MGRNRKRELIEKISEKPGMLIENVIEGISIVDPEENLIFLNQAFADMSGYKKDELIGVNLRKLVSEEDFKKIRRQTHIRRRGKVSRYELVLYRKDGQPRNVIASVAPLWNDDGSLAGCLGIIMDITELKKAEEKLRKQKEKYKKYCDVVGNIIVALDSNGKITFLNKKGYEILGYKEGQLIGKNWFETCLPEESREKVKKVFKKCMQGKLKMVEHYENPVITKNGEKRIISWHNTVLTDDKGKIVGTLSSGEDITERVQMEKALRESEEKFRVITTAAKDAIIVINDEGRITYWNPAAERMFGYTKEEVLGKKMYKIIIPKRFHKSYLKGFAKFVKTGQGLVIGKTLEFTGLRKDGKEFPVEFSSSAFQMKGKWHSLAIARDLTERKKTEKAILESKEKFERLFRNNPEAAVYSDKNFRILDINPRFTELFGYSLEEIKGKHINEVVVPEDKKKEAEELDKKARKGYFSYDTVRKRKDGTLVSVSISVAPITVENKLVGYVGLYKDITERLQMQKKLQEYSEHLEELVEKRTKQLREMQQQLLKAERLAAIGELAGMVGHDLRNPLTSIASAVYYLKTKLGSKVDKKTREMLKLIEKSVEYSNKIIRDLLEYSREIKLELSETTPKSIVKEALALVKIPKKVQVLDLTRDKPKIKVDVEKMKRVLVNIIKNAIEAMPKGGKLTIRSRTRDNSVEITFTDTGVGMSKETLKKIWNPFFTTKAKGMGLGLSICKRIVEAHGGKIFVKSTVGKGTTFTVIMPVQLELDGGEKVWVNMPESSSSTMMKA